MQHTSIRLDGEGRSATRGARNDARTPSPLCTRPGLKIPKIDYSHLLLKADVKGRTSNCFCTRAYKGAQTLAKREGCTHTQSAAVGQEAWAKAKTVYERWSK